jgi:hypothetical protein
MANTGHGADRATKWIRWIARIWSIVIIGITLVMIIAHAIMPEPNATDYPPIENLLPLAMCLSVAGLGLAWRWEGLVGRSAWVSSWQTLGYTQYLGIWDLESVLGNLGSGVQAQACLWRSSAASGLVKADWRPHPSEFSHLLILGYPPKVLPAQGPGDPFASAHHWDVVSGLLVEDKVEEFSSQTWCIMLRWKYNELKSNQSRRPVLARAIRVVGYRLLGLETE